MVIKVIEMGRMSELHIEMEEDYRRLTEEEFLAEYGQANYEYIKEFLDPDLKAEDMPDQEAGIEFILKVNQAIQHSTANTEWTKLDQQIHDKDWEEWNKTIT
jgi:hypothetical protein